MADVRSDGAAAGPDTSPPEPALRGGEAPLTGWRRVAFWIGSVASGLLVLATHGFLPGMSQAPLTAFMGVGTIQCLHDQGISSLRTWCMSVGVPVGEPRLKGQPEILLGWLIGELPGVDSWAAHQIEQGAFTVLALAGGYALLRRWHVERWLALGATVVYLVSPNLVTLNGYSYTFLGYLLLPAAAYAALRVLDLMATGRWVPAGLAALGLSLFLAFTDGYVFMSAALVVGVLLLEWSWRRRRDPGLRALVPACAIWLGSLAASAFAYAAYVPGTSYETASPLDHFGLLGNDVATLGVPSRLFWLPRGAGIDPPVPEVWGYGAQPQVAYLGWVAVAVAIGYLVVGFRRRRLRGEVVAVVLSGVIALFLSLGPTLKVTQTEPGIANSLLTLPTAWLYEHVPGFSDMRATNRWFVVTRFSLLAVAAVGLSLAWRSWAHGRPGRRTLVAVVAVAVAAEVLPYPVAVVHQREASIAKVHEVRDGILADARRLLRPDELVLILPSDNDLLTNYLVPMAGVRSYNVGGDKNYLLSVESWPAEVRAARDSYGMGSLDPICRVLDDGLADAVVLTTQRMWAAPLFLAEPEDDATRREQALDAARDARFDARVGEKIVVLRAAGAVCDS